MFLRRPSSLGDVVLEQARMTPNVVQRGDALALLRSLPDGCTSLVFFDPQYRGVLGHLQYGNEGSRQRGRFGFSRAIGAPTFLKTAGSSDQAKGRGARGVSRPQVGEKFEWPTVNPGRHAGARIDHDQGEAKSNHC